MSGHAEEEYKAVDERWVLKSEVLVFWFVFRDCFVSLSSRVAVSYQVPMYFYHTVRKSNEYFVFIRIQNDNDVLAEIWYVHNLFVLLVCVCMSCFSYTTVVR